MGASRAGLGQGKIVRGTAFLLVDGSAALGRAPAVPRHWLAALVIVIVFQWVLWQGEAISYLIAERLLASGVLGLAGDEMIAVQVVGLLLSLALPTAIAAALALYLSARLDRRSPQALGLDFMTAPTGAAWLLAGLLAASPVIVDIAMKGPALGALVQALALLTPITVVQAGAEEIVFRGIVLASLSARYGVGAGLIISAALFGFWHLAIGQPLVDGAVSFAATFVFGLTAGLLTLHYGNLGPALALHVVWNVGGYMGAGFAQWEMEFWPAWLASYSDPWTNADLGNGEVMKHVVLPLAIETLLVLAACRETLFRLLAPPRRAPA